MPDAHTRRKLMFKELADVWTEFRFHVKMVRYAWLDSLMSFFDKQDKR